LRLLPSLFSPISSNEQYYPKGNDSIGDTGGRRVTNFRNLSSSTLLSNFALVIMAPQRTDLVLASDIPHLRWQPTVMEVALVQMSFSLFEKKIGEFLGESMLMLVFLGRRWNLSCQRSFLFPNIIKCVFFLEK